MVDLPLVVQYPATQKSEEQQFECEMHVCPSAPHLDLQICDEHASPVLHATQDAPPLPHALSRIPSLQIRLMSQHPFGHVAGLHLGLQLCDVQRSLVLHVMHMSPPVPHALSKPPDRQVPLASQHPDPHVDGPHDELVHVPATHMSPGQHWTAEHDMPLLRQDGVEEQMPPVHVSPVQHCEGDVHDSLFALHDAMPPHLPPTHASVGEQQSVAKVHA